MKDDWEIQNGYESFGEGKGNMKNKRKRCLFLLALCVSVCVLSGCGSGSGGAEGGGGKRIVYVGHNQPADHPTNLGMLAFEEYIEKELGDKYDVQVFPNELLGSQTDMVQLTQTGAIDVCVASNAIMETFSPAFTLFNLPYLFTSVDAFYAAMEDEGITEPIFSSTEDAGFSVVTWLDLGTRNFYTVSRAIEKPEDLRGLKIRVQQSATNVEMMKRLGGSATPMGFGDVYTALQSNIIDGAENSEIVLTANGHGEVCKYFSYDMHQITPDSVIVSNKFLESLPEEDRAVFEEGFALINQVERENWGVSIEAAKEKAETEQEVQFIYPDTKPFQDLCYPIHEEYLEANPDKRAIYDKIQEYNMMYVSESEQRG